MRIAFKTFGCKANSVDSDMLYLEAQRRGFNIVSEDDTSDACIINSCTVTENADKEARTYAQSYKRKNPLSKIGIIGCYAQVAKEELLTLPEIDYVIGTANKFKILDLIEKEESKNQVEATAGFLPEEFLGSRHSRASIKIQDGCNFNCSFCIIPQARGRSRSLSIENIVTQYQQAHQQGFQEVILTGIHLAHYGWDLNTDLLNLLKVLLSEKEGPRIRLSTLDPFEIPDELISLMKNNSRLCPHFHIAIQSGSDKILKAMRRIYKAEEFKVVCNKIFKEIPNVFIGVDVIVGFPGETDVEFNETLDILQNSYWTKLHVFPFSVRRNTAAEKLTDFVDPKVIQERAQMLRIYSDTRYGHFLNTQLGATKNVIVEAPKPNGLQTGHTENYIPIVFRADNVLQKNTYPMSMKKILKDKIWAEL
jgi:threonylcarbamoyladenosine tRNA methylthiotransferase MtaB